jgi:Alpha/beta hydrolase domain
MTARVRVPTVFGPIAGAQPPWGTPRTDVGALGYVVEEYQLEGTAVAYELAPETSATIDGRWEVQESQEATYRTRILVVRPEHAERFNGTVVVNWQNVSAGFESDGPSGGEIFDGYAWVGVSAQEVGLYGFPMGMDRLAVGGTRPLVDHDPERYGSLQHPGDQGSFDIFSQAGRAVGPERSAAVDPMGGLEIHRMIAAGASQSAMRLAAYLNAVHPLANVFDGFLLAVWEGRAPRLEEGPIAMGVRTMIRADHTTPVVVVNSEFEAPNLAALPISDTDRLRVWEVAGTPHGVARSRDDRAGRDGWVVNRLSYSPVYEAALCALQRWLADGVSAAAQPRIAFDPGPSVAIRRDDFGNTVGGIRLPELEAPTHEYRGMSFGTGRPPLFGAARRFSDDALRVLYPTRAGFVDRWRAAVDALVNTGALRPQDAPAMQARAEAVELPVD